MIILITIQFVSIFFFLANYSRIPVIQCIFPVKYVSLVIAQNNKHQTVFAVYGEIGCTLFLRIGLCQRIFFNISCSGYCFYFLKKQLHLQPVQMTMKPIMSFHGAYLV